MNEDPKDPRQGLHADRPHGRIVVVDDEAALRLTFQQFLAEEGYEVRTAANGEEGVRLCQSFQPDLVITDLMMPVQDGFTTIEILQRDLPELPIIAMSATMGSEGRQRTLGLGAVCCVTKPVDFHALLIVVRQYIRQIRGTAPSP